MTSCCIVQFACFLMLLCGGKLILVECRPRTDAERAIQDAERNEQAIRMKTSWIDAASKMKKFLRQMHIGEVPVEKINLVLFHLVTFNGGKDSQDVPMNNVKLFVSSVLQHTHHADQKAFYLFSVGSGPANAFYKFLPLHLPNVAATEWPVKAAEKDTPIRSMLMLGDDILSNFSSITVSSDRVRGPVVGRKDAGWISTFRSLLDDNNVGIVGSSISCDGLTHVQPHMYMIRAALVQQVVDKLKATGNIGDGSVNAKLKGFAEGMSKTATGMGYQISSILTHARLNKKYFDGKCIEGTNTPEMPQTNPTSWCNIKAEEVIFIKWGGVPLRMYGQICPAQIQAVQKWLVELTQSDAVLQRDSNLQLTLPETLQGGLLYEMQKMYNLEMWKDRLPRLPMPVDINTGVNNKVCFVVLAGRKHDYTDHIRQTTLFLKVTIDGMIKSLLRQSNPYWSAYFVNIDDDDADFDSRLREIVQTIADPRVHYHMKYSHGEKLMRNGRDKHVMFDSLLRSIANIPSCKYLSITSADNFYGSEVVQQVLTARLPTPPQPIPPKLEGKDSAAATSAHPQQLLQPEESQQFPRLMAYSEKSPMLTSTYSTQAITSPYQRAFSFSSLFSALTGAASDSSGNPSPHPPQSATSSDGGQFQSVVGASSSSSLGGKSLIVAGPYADSTPHIVPEEMLQPDIVLNPLDSKQYAEQEYTHRNSMRPVESEFNERCVGIDAMTSLKLLPYTVQPSPIMGRLNFAAVFFNRDKFNADNVFFGNITIPSKVPPNCMPCQDGYMTEYLVRFKRWTYTRLPKDGIKSIVFHGPSPSLCISSGNVWFDYPHVNKVGCLAQKTVDLIKKQDEPETPNFDWTYFHKMNRLCLRLTEQGFNHRQDIIFK